jgi:hypothetical protein
VNAAIKGSPLLIHRAIRKYGAPNFSVRVLESVVGVRDDLMAAEIRHISEQGCMTPQGYNLTPGGDGVDWSNEEVRQRHAKGIQKVVSNPEWRARRAEINRAVAATPAWQQANAEGARKRSANPEWRKNISAAQKKVAVDPCWQAMNVTSLVLARVAHSARAVARDSHLSPEVQAARAAERAYQREWKARRRASERSA